MTTYAEEDFEAGVTPTFGELLGFDRDALVASSGIAQVGPDALLFIDDTVLDGMQPGPAKEIVKELRRLEATYGIAVSCLEMVPEIGMAEAILDGDHVILQFSQGLFGVGNEGELERAFEAARALNPLGAPFRLFDTPAKVACHEYGHVLAWTVLAGDGRLDAFDQAVAGGDSEGQDQLQMLSSYAAESAREAVAEAFLGYELGIDNPWCALVADMLASPQVTSAVTTAAFPVRHGPASGRYLPKGSEGGAPKSADEAGGELSGVAAGDALLAARGVDAALDREGIVDWSGSSFRLTGAQRSGTRLDGHSKRIDSALRDTLAPAPAALSVTRFVGVDNAFAGQLPDPGQTIADKAWATTALDRAEAVDIFGGWNQQPVELEIHVAKGQPVSYLGRIEYDEDGEVFETYEEMVLPPETPMRVRAVDIAPEGHPRVVVDVG